MRWLLLIGAACGCSGGGGDPAAPDAPADDRDADPPACDLTAPFGDPVELGVGSVDHNWTAAIARDERSIYFSDLDDALGDRVYVAHRDTIDEPFGAAELLPILGPDGVATFPTGLGDGGRALFLHSEREGGLGGTDVYLATRDDPSDDAGWGAPVRLDALSSGAGDCCGYPSGDGGAVYVTTGGVLSRAAADGAGGFEAPVPIAELDTGVEWSPVVSPDQRTIYFARDTATDSGDLWVATRASASDAFGPAEPVVELNTPEYDIPVGVSDDGCRLYLISNARGGPGATDIYVASRPD